MPQHGRSSDTADVVVLGGGIIGTAVAQRLASADIDVLLVESADGLGTGTSGRCDGNLLLQTKEDEVLIQLTQQSIEIYRRWDEELSLDIRFEQEGSLVFLTDADQVPKAQQRLMHLRSRDISADLIDAAALKELEPNLVGEFPGAIHCHDDAEVYPPSVVAALAVDAKRRGARVLSGTTAQELVVDKQGSVCGVKTSAGLISTRHVVNALGVWAAHFQVPEAAPPIPVSPRQGVLVVTEESPGLIRNNIREASYLTDRSGHEPSKSAKISFAAEPTYRGNILLGSSRHFADYDVHVDLAIVSSIMQRALTFVPALRNVHIVRTFAGLRPWTPDNRPLIGPCAAVPGYFVATGHEGEGIGLAPATAELIATSLLRLGGTALHKEALRTLSPDRFETRSSAGTCSDADAKATA